MGDNSQKINDNILERTFDLKANQTTVRQEIVAGTTIFVAMSYILFVNPTVLGATGMDQGAIFVATALAAIIGCLATAFLANYPIAIAPSLGSNAFFAYTVVLGMKVPWQTALAGVFVASILFLLVTIFKVREKIINNIPADLKSAIAAGIGLFVAFVGLQNGGLVQTDKSTLLTITNFHNPTVWLTVFGLVLTLILVAKKVPANMLIGMAVTSIVGIVTGLIKMPHAIVAPIPSLKPTFGQALFHIQDVFNPQMITVVIIFFLVAFFDTTGTVVGLLEQAGLMKRGEKVSPRVGKALLSDATAMIGSSIFGSSPTSAYVESSTGIAVGGRTGLTSLTVAVFFAASLFFSPLLAVVTSQVTAPIMIIVGSYMVKSLGNIDWSKFESAFPAFVTIAGMPLFYDISYGFAFGVMSYVIIMIAEGKAKKVHPIMYLAFVVFLFLLIAMNQAH
ncbi:NCS2 family permease [Bombilactobacillus bombi]|uniref:NCS2 family permease n=1 Tax=Bombilactobacillus bombi TaxID=1303590 RepID=A0A3R6YTE0_9LACO|nr:NCS2 family permease [Bombilactobacillus bombi]MCO6542268.1 NCS2 family permease [Lactobacillus sp.]RHW51370.1 NCS2 family permease [Bombilactobacillus bombi]